MNQNLPPNQQEPNNPYMQGSGQASEPGVSSYGYQQQSSATPDLDANAPSLKANELQRLNRKAMVFLAGIIALLLVMAIWLVMVPEGQNKAASIPNRAAVISCN